MSFDPVPSSQAHGNIDEQISQLMQCKPLSEQEVSLLIPSTFVLEFLDLSRYCINFVGQN